MNLTLKIAILKSGKPQRYFAQALGIGEARFSNIVHDVHPPRETEAAALAKLLGKSVDELFAKAEVM